MQSTLSLTDFRQLRHGWASRPYGRRFRTCRSVELDAGDRGFEPRHTDPESAVLPLDESPTINEGLKYTITTAQAKEIAGPRPQIALTQIRIRNPEIKPYFDRCREIKPLSGTRRKRNIRFGGAASAGLRPSRR